MLLLPQSGSLAPGMEPLWLGWDSPVDKPWGVFQRSRMKSDHHIQSSYGCLSLGILFYAYIPVSIHRSHMSVLSVSYRFVTISQNRCVVGWRDGSVVQERWLLLQRTQV